MRKFLFLTILLSVIVMTIFLLPNNVIKQSIRGAIRLTNQPYVMPSEEVDCEFCAQRIASCAAELPHAVRYVPDYVKINYPMGDVPANTGVCTDVVIRALRCCGLDLQEEVFKHRRRNGKSTDTNIDHRRTPNIGAYLADDPNWKVIPVAQAVQPGDIIWRKSNRNRDHMGVAITPDRVMHNFGHGVWADASPNDFVLKHIYRLR